MSTGAASRTGVPEEMRFAAPSQPASDDLGLTPEAPWLGLRSFTERVRDYFYGRETEIQTLFDRIQHRTLTVLFGQSGLGKTSLLQAGVIPRLRDAEFTPITIRLDHVETAEPLEQQVIRAIADRMPSVRLPAETRLTLWELFHDRSCGLTDVANPPVLIIDQFEELFTLGEEKRAQDARRFFEALSCLVENRPPAAVREAMEHDEDLVGRLMRGPSSCKILLALRDDFLSRLERGRLQMPSMMDNRMELRMLSGTQAYRAVYEPGTKNSTRPIVSRDTSRAIVRFVAGAPPDAPLEEIENVPPLLSLICEQLNARRLAQGDAAIHPEALTRSAPEVLRNFYNDRFAPHPAAVRAFVEDELVSASGFRESKTVDSAKAVFRSAGVLDPEATLRQLVDERLLVIEDRGGVARIELTHDILSPIAAAARNERAARERRHARTLKQRRRLAIGALLLGATTLAVWTVWAKFTEQRMATTARSLVKSLQIADTGNVPATIREMQNYRKWIDPLLRNERATVIADYRHRLNTRLVRFSLLPADSTRDDFEYLYSRLLDLDHEPRAMPVEFLVIREALAPRKSELVGRLWDVVQSTSDGQESERLRAASALALYDPDNPLWSQVGSTVANDLVGSSAVYLSLWVAGLRPVRANLIASLSETYRSSQRDSERKVACDILADYAEDDVTVLTELMLNADLNQFATIYSKFEKFGEQKRPALAAVLRKSFDDINRASPENLREDAKEELARQQANAAVILLRMNQFDEVWPLLKHSPDPRVRSLLIHRVGPLGADPQPMIDRLNRETDVSIKRALLLCLGEFRADKLPAERRWELVPRLRELYRQDLDPGMHAAAEWLLRHWGDGPWVKNMLSEWAQDTEWRAARLGAVWSSRGEDRRKASVGWYVNDQGQTLVVMPGPNVFWMGSPDTEAMREDDETRHRKRINLSFAMSASPVTVEEYRRFDPSYQSDPKITTTEDSPVVRVNWHHAAAYCNWLSAQADLPPDQWCYDTEMDANGNTRVVRLRNNYLALTGYRLPQEAEIEFATRAGAVTARCYGETDELLPEYAWFIRNSQRQTWPVGLLKPNDFGLFDVHGNVNFWCQEILEDYPKPDSEQIVDDEERQLEITRTEPRGLRGGSFKDDASLVRSAYRNSVLPDQAYSYLGFRIVRTLLPTEHKP